MAHSIHLPPGTTVDRYTVLHRLGEGGMATVYAVQHTLLETRHALKVLHSADEGIRERLLREGRLQARLDPSYVVPVTDVIEVYGSPSLVMPLVDGCSLEELLHHHRPTEAEAAAIFASIVTGVRSAHEAGVIHRDLKPANVLLEIKRGQVLIRVADFGLARAVEVDHGRTQTGMVMGTPAYAAPEQMRDTSSADHRADLWSLGVMLFELLTGERPFQSESLVALYRATVHADYDVSATPERWREVVDALLQPERSDRVQSAALLAQRLPASIEPASLGVGTPIAEAVRLRINDAERRRAYEDRSQPANATLDGSLDETQAPTAPDGPTPPRHNLPRERDPFVGRERDLAALHERVHDGALVSVLGIGGTGKTRLVLHFARRHWSEWPGGIWFCDLSEARSAEDICIAVARALEVPLDKGDPVVKLGHAIAGRGRCVVILDNLEQVVRHAPHTLGRWLDRASEAVFVVTTREVLGLRGENLLPLAPLDPVDSSAMFIARAEAAKHGFSPSEDDRAAIEKLVALLDHLPLAIELAAARVRVLPAQKLLGRMTDRFRMLTSTGGRRDRQATLRATLDWSWDLLAPWERSALAQLAVFEGGFDMEAAEAVIALDAFDDAPWAIDAVQALVDKSLVRTVGDGRFGLLVSVQAYAAEKLAKLGDVEGAELRHGAYYAGFGAEDALESLSVHGGVALWQALAVERANLALASRRAVARADAEVAAATALAAGEVFDRTGPSHVAVAVLEAALGVQAPESRDAARLALALGRAQRSAGRVDQAVAQFSAALELSTALGDRRLQGQAHSHLGLLLETQARMDEARAHFETAIATAREVGDRRLEGEALSNLGLLHKRQGRMDEARAHYESALLIARAMGNRNREARVLTNFGALHLAQGRMAHARDAFEGGLAIHREVGNRRSEGIVLGNLGNLHFAQGLSEEPRTHYEAALNIHRAVGNRVMEGNTLGNLGGLHKRQGRLDAAQTHYEAALVIVREAQNRWLEGVLLGNLGDLHREQGRMAEARTRLDAGEALVREVGDPVVLGLMLCFRGTLLHETGDVEGVRAALGEAEALAEQVKAGPSSDLVKEIERVTGLVG